MTPAGAEVVKSIKNATGRIENSAMLINSGKQLKNKRRKK